MFEAIRYSIFLMCVFVGGKILISTSTMCVKFDVVKVTAHTVTLHMQAARRASRRPRRFFLLFFLVQRLLCLIFAACCCHH